MVSLPLTMLLTRLLLYNNYLQYFIITEMQGNVFPKDLMSSK